MATEDPYKNRKPGDEPLFRTITTEDSNWIIDRGQETLGSFRAALAAGKYPDALENVKVFIPDQDDGGAHLWVGIKKLVDDGFICDPFEIPTGIVGIEMGKYFYVPDEAVEDWMLNVDGKLYGGYSLRLHRKNLPEERRANYDAYVGVKEYADELP